MTAPRYFRFYLKNRISDQISSQVFDLTFAVQKSKVVNQTRLTCCGERDFLHFVIMYFMICSFLHDSHSVIYD